MGIQFRDLMIAKLFTSISFHYIGENEKQKFCRTSIFLLLINLIVIKCVTESLNLSLQVAIWEIQVSMSYFDQILGKRGSQYGKVFHFAGI